MKINMAKWLMPFGVVLALVVVSSPVQATLLPPGSTVVPDSSTAGPVGAALATITSPFTTPGGTTGSVREDVFRDASGGIDFVYQVSVTSGSSAIVRMSSINFSGFTTDVSAAAGPALGFPAGTVAPTNADRSAGVGQTVGFNYPLGAAGTGGIPAGSTSFIMIIRTNSLTFTSGVIGVTNGGTANVPGFSPTPEPASLVLLASCFLGVGGVYAWRRKGVPTAG